MRSVKGIIIGFLLILLGFAAAQYSLIAAGILSAGGLAAVVVSALPKRAEKQEPQAAPAAPVPAPAELSVPELLPDILTDPPVQPKCPRCRSRRRRRCIKRLQTRIRALTRFRAAARHGCWNGISGSARPSAPAGTARRQMRRRLRSCGKGALCRVFQRISSAGLRQARQDPQPPHVRRSAGGSERRRFEADRAATGGA